MKARKKWNRFFAMLLVATLIFNSQATALLAMDSENFGVAGDETKLLPGAGGSTEIIDEGDTQIIPDGDVEDPSSGSETQTGNGQDDDILLGQEVVPGTNSAASQEKESEADPLTEAEKEMLADPSDSENGSGADEEFGPALDVEEDSDVTIVDEETEPQTSEQGKNAQEPVEDEAGTEEEEDDVEIMAMGLDDGIMLTATDLYCDGATINGKLYDEIQDAIDAAEDGETIQLREGSYGTLKHNLNIDLKGRNITLDLNGRNLEAKETKAATITVRDSSNSDAILTIKNDKTDGGQINGNTSGNSNDNEYSGGSIDAKNVNLILQGTSFIRGKRTGKGGGAIYQSGGTLTMYNVTGKGTEVSGCNGDGASFVYATDNCVVSMENITLTGFGSQGKVHSVAYFKGCESVNMQNVSFVDGTFGNTTVSENRESIVRLDACEIVSIGSSKFENNTKSGSAVISVLNGSNLTLSDSILSGNGSGTGSIYVGNNSILTIKNTNITGEANSNGLYIAKGGSVTMETGALYGSRMQDVVIEEGALSVSLPAVAEMSIPSDLKEEYKLWIKEGESKKGLSERLEIASAEEQSAYKVSVLKSDEAQIIRKGEEDTPILYDTFVKAVQDAQDGDVIQLLPDTLDSEAGPQNRVIKVRETAAIKSGCSITIDLNKQELNLSETSTDKAYISIPAGVELTVKGPGRMTGGYVNNNLTGLNETVWVGTTLDGTNKAQLTITEEAYVEGIKNYGVTKVINGAQVSQIAQICASKNPEKESFVLDTELRNSLKVLLDSVVGSKNLDSKVRITVGEHFSIGESVDKIDFALSYGGSLKNPDFIKNSFIKWLNTEGAKTISLIDVSEVSKDVIRELVGMTEVSNVPIESTECTASICVVGNNIALYRNEGFVYLGGSDADDDNIGYSNTAPVATMKKAIELAQAEGTKQKIYLVGTVKVTEKQGAQTWDMPDDINLELYGEFAENGHSGPFAEVEKGGSLTLKKIEIKGAGTNVTSNAPLIKVNNGGKLLITDGAILSDNNHGYDNYGSVGGAVYSDGGEITMDGGVIRNCKAYNGGAVYCNGGSFIMSGGTLGGTLNEKSAGNSAKEAGGAVMLANGARMTLSGSALISENTATDSVIIGYDELGPIYGGDGGGIAVGGCRADSVEKSPYFEMQGGRISHNKMFTCGGGIFVQANAEARIIQGTIDNNTDMGTSGNFGGGGIYVNGARGEIDRAASKPGYLYLENVLITGNVAQYDVGGGIAACPTASAKIYLTGGAAIYGNKYEDKSYYRTLSDILIRRDSFKSSGTEIDVSEYMSNGQPYLWKEYNDDDDSGVGRLHRSDDMAEYNLYTEQNYKDDTKDFKVFIIDNTCYQAGGGIGANGTVEIGIKPDVVSISAKKVWMDAGRKANRPNQKIKVWLLRKVEDGEFEHVAAEYLEPDKNGNWDSAMVTFPEQPKFAPDGETPYEYTVKEEAEGIGPYVSTVTKDEVENSWVITNTYTPEPTTVTVVGTKVLTGREWTDEDSFTFELTETTTAEAGKTVPDRLPATKTATATKAAQNFDFGEIKYTEPYVHTYTVKETSKSDKGITVDGNTYTVTVTVMDNEKGVLSATVTYPQKEKDEEGKETETLATKLMFTNTYTAADGTASVSAKKTLTGRANGLQANEFAFSLTPVSAVGTDGKTTITDSNAVQTDVRNAANGAVNFKELTYTKAGKYTYVLRETSTNKNGVTVDETAYTVTVSVTDDSEGQLQTSVAYKKGSETVTADQVIFANTYKAKAGTATVNATKTLTGRANGLQANEFEFSLTPKSAVGGADGKTEIDDPNEAQTGVRNAANGAVNFKELMYTEAGKYTYELRETSTNKNGVTVDGTAYTVTVTVTDNNEGQLNASVTYNNGTRDVEAKDVIFTNTYKAAAGTASVSATKILTGRKAVLKDKEFSFSLTPMSAFGTDGKAITDANTAQTDVKNDGAGKITFAALNYTQAGTYTYELREEDTAVAGVTKDPAVYTVTVTVTDNNLGQLTTNVKYSKNGGEVDAEDVVFENVYDAEDTSIQLGATKAFDRPLTGGEFTFVLQEVDQNGNVVASGIRQQKTNEKDGSIRFDAIEYNEEGTHYYQISETAGNDPTILSYDATVKTVTVTVEDVDAKLVATADLSAADVVFTNRSTSAKIDKRDADTNGSISGAVLRIVDRGNANAVVEQWTSNGAPHEILGKLSKGGSYALEEVTAPDGYLPTGPVEFTMNEKGEVVVAGQVTDMVVMRDTKNTISLLKLDENGQPLSGAHLVIETTDGTAVDSWVSDGTPHVTRGLARGHYVMSEIEAPAGYHVAEDVPFEITGTETQPVEVRMTDAKIPEKDNNKLTVMKHLRLDGITCDIGIHEAKFYVALFSDEERTHRVSDVKTLEFHDDALSTATFENLGKGTYYVGETDENGVPMHAKKINNRVIYYAEYGENSEVQFEGRKGEGTAELTNVYVEIPEENFYLSGRLTITKKVLIDGRESASDDTFYAGVFTDAALTSRIGDVVALGMNGGSSASVTIYNMAIGETLDSSSTYYVAETDANGTPLNPDEITEYRISVDKSEIVMDADHANQEVVITNDFSEEETEIETEEGADITDSPGSSPESGSSAPKTGDETDSLRYLLYMALSAGLFATAAGEKRRRQKRVKK